MIDDAITKRIGLSRYLYHLAEHNLQSSRDVAAAAGINLLHDATEVFLLAIADHVNADIKSKTRFEQYIDMIDQKINPKTLPYRSKLLRLNKLRVDSKHHGQFPEQRECNEILRSVKQFLFDTAKDILDVNFATISLVDHLDKGETQEILRVAEIEFANENYQECLIGCRKAIFLEIENRYDISDFQEPEFATKNFLGAALCLAPFHAKNSQYIENNVHDPTDFIVLDHQSVDNDLLKNGIDTREFWNIWRLTPKVYRASSEGNWAVKFDLQQMDGDLKETAEYVLPTTIEIVLTWQRANKVHRISLHNSVFEVALKRENVSLYKKADKQGQVAYVTPDGLTKLFGTCYVNGLNDDSRYLLVSTFVKNSYVQGFIHDDDVKSVSRIDLESND